MSERDTDLLARAYDDTDDEHIADLYTEEVVAEFEESWWIRVEEVSDSD